MKKITAFLLCFMLLLPCFTVSAADGFRYSKSGNRFVVTTNKTKYEGSTFIIARYSQNDEYETCEVVTLQTIGFSDDTFSSGIFTMEQGFDYKYMVFDGCMPMTTNAVSLNINTSNGTENTEDDEGSPRV